ncbi:MAG: BRO family protein [Sarcina sp.]
MNGKLVKYFENIEVYTFIWNGEPCWVAINVAEMLGYKNTSKTITNCIKRESFACGVDREYEVLSGEDLKDKPKVIFKK